MTQVANHIFSGFNYYLIFFRNDMSSLVMYNLMNEWLCHVSEPMVAVTIREEWFCGLIKSLRERHATIYRNQEMDFILLSSSRR